MKLKKQSQRRKLKWIPRIALAVLFLIAFAFTWYLAVRMQSRSNAVKVYDRQGNPADRLREDSALRVVCHNIAHGRGGKFGCGNFEGTPKEKKERVAQIGRLLKDMKPDIIVLNEADFSSVWSGHQNQAEIIARESGMPYLATQRNFDAAIPFASLRFGNAILSRYPISNARLIEFPPLSRYEKRFFGNHDGLICEITLPDGGKVRVLAVHLETRSETIRVQCARTILTLRAESDIPMIAAGDFNSTPAGFPAHNLGKAGDNAMDILLGNGAFSTLPAVPPPDPAELTFPSEAPRSLIDWILVQSPLKIMERRAIKSNLSDHLPVFARVGSAT